MTWLHTFKFKDLLTDEDVPPEVAANKGRIAADRLKSSPFQGRKYLSEQFLAVIDQESFNECLDKLYDAADAQRIWVE